MLAEPDPERQHAAMYYEPYFLNTEQFFQQLRDDSQRYGETLKRLNISLD